MPKQMEIYKRYRPRTLKAIVGQAGAMASLQKLMDKGSLPHTILLAGPSGCGKTTVGRIIKEYLKCGDADFQEINSADFKGIEMVRDIRRNVNLAPMDGENRVWLIDEAHELTGDAQNAFLKLLEDTPRHAYFMLATTRPGKLIKGVLTRCTEILFTALSETDLERVLQRVLDKEQAELTDKVKTEIVTASDGSARKALVILEQVIGLETEEEQIAGVKASSIDKDVAIDLARGLINGKRWVEIAAVLREIKDDPEGVRYLVLSYCRTVMLGGGKLADRAYFIINRFRDNFYDSKQAGLAAACWEVCHPPR